MQEVTIEIQFTRPCLGYAKQSLDKGRGVIYRMPRDGVDRVMFLPSWWKNGFKFASKVLGRYHSEAVAVAWSPPVTGALSQWQRDIPAKNTKRRRYALHESFRPGTIVTLFAVLPADLAIPDFIELLSIVGNYKGVSPFQSEDETYGTFNVISVTPTERSNLRDQNDRSIDSPIRHTD